MAKKRPSDPSPCDVCGALVPVKAARQHRDWHTAIVGAIQAVGEGGRSQAHLLHEHLDNHAKLADLVERLAGKLPAGG